MSDSVQTMDLTLQPACQHVLPITFQPQGNGYMIRSDHLKCKLCGEEFVAPWRDGYRPTLSIPILPAALTIGMKPETAPSAGKSPKKAPEPPDPSKGLPGTEMLQVTKELGIEDKPGCGCKSTAAQMDRMGVEGCRMRSPDLKMVIQANWDSWKWQDKLKAATSAMWKAVGLGVNPTDPIKDLVELAIDRAEQKAKQASEA